ncbi:hypothetical protein DM02DRAFT_308023 [Periconia macrospinosa]|uniref:RING-type domain-containing protein n=1 Tax=Periconia macrospinosa TaxID=97972 RepID=A0A2V1DVF5_9PLEO|nr:hypothetical protein DM02DRAFT_308023 [Periconia macrospinosa]
MGNTSTKPSHDDLFDLRGASRRHPAPPPAQPKKKNDGRAHRKVSPRQLIEDNDDDISDGDDRDAVHPRRSSRAESHTKSETTDRSGTRKKKASVRRDSGHDSSLVSVRSSTTKSGQARQSRKAERRKHSDRERRFISRELYELDDAFSRTATNSRAAPHDHLTDYLNERRRALQFRRGKHGRRGSASHGPPLHPDEHNHPSSGGTSSSDEVSHLHQKTSLLHRPRTPQQPPSTPQTQECPICTCILPITRFPKHPATSTCTHLPTTCRRCLRMWLHTSFQTKLWDQLTCPECGAQLQHADVQRCAGKRVFEKYDGLATKAVLEGMEGFRWCLVKDTRRKRGKKAGEKAVAKGKGKGREANKVAGGGCGSGQIHGAGPKMECVGCGTVQCVNHAILWHEGETCAEYDYRTDSRLKKAEEEASKELIKQTTKKCPSCNRNIEKSSGCDHMTCKLFLLTQVVGSCYGSAERFFIVGSKCKHEFCWLCMAAYDPIRKQGNHMHRSNCQYFRVS